MKSLSAVVAVGLVVVCFDDFLIVHDYEIVQIVSDFGRLIGILNHC